MKGVFISIGGVKSSLLSWRCFLLLFVSLSPGKPRKTKGFCPRGLPDQKSCKMCQQHVTRDPLSNHKIFCEKRKPFQDVCNAILFRLNGVGMREGSCLAVLRCRRKKVENCRHAADNAASRQTPIRPFCPFHPLSDRPPPCLPPRCPAQVET